ncbi:MAG: PspC domain-containing protein [Bacteroidota bacterium]
MKKNVSINIGGIIFHVEEDGYTRLQKYLDSISSYFSSFDESKEIIDDIENRIAELFLAKLDEGKQIITDEDISDLITKMGTTADFEAAIEVETPASTSESDEQQKEQAAGEKEENTSTSSKTEPKRLKRDTKRKMLGGVAAGMANYFQVDVIWIRLLFVVLLFNILLPGLSGFIFLTYIILWIAIPEDNTLEEPSDIKKLFRSNEDKVLGGVAGGIASYFGVDVVLVRVLFVLSIFTGIGIFFYIILWIITPLATSITDRMQMQGEPVTISNIENTVKKRLNVDENKEESALVKVLLFPFRLIALLFKFLSEALGPLFKVLVEVLRVVAGVFLFLLGLVLMIALSISILVIVGVGSAFESWVQLGGFTPDEVFASIGIVALVSAYLATLVPSLGLALLGIAILVKKRVVRASIGWTLFALWVLGMIGLAFSVPKLVSSYRYENTFREERVLEVKDAIPTLRADGWDEVRFEDAVELRLRGHQDSVYRLKMEFESKGASRRKARKNAEDVDYQVVYDGDDLLFDTTIDLNETPFRFQTVEATFYLPYGKVFRMDEELSEILRNSLWMYDYDRWDMDGNEWVFDEDGLRCLTCEKQDD